ncbi:mechanosensitive ion channel protein MscS [Pontibacter sp. SGAir0037]|uniref:mechanosensitive ion channel protein MscS n=1 Tax=Pontibacter sp. SGAir0037 TaxID=2571030 RepID=UPI0010CCC3A6|nr:mechanosensitive ion channel protein MscS [Pontibacter sp. SGAir0037]QCR21053.1 mechanosensitive ion channel protein MscS [Pontibacter sp. SGAir0037]
MMKGIIYAVLLGVGMAACLADQNNNADETTEAESTTTPTLPAGDRGLTPDASFFIIGKGKVGPIRIGMPVADLRPQLSSQITFTDTTLQQEGQQYTAFVLRPEQDANGLLVEQQCDTDCRIWRINIQSQDYKTTKGIGVGSKFSEVQANYPISTISQAEGNLVAVSEQAGLSFVLNKSQVDLNRSGDLAPADIPANTLVQRLLVY